MVTEAINNEVPNMSTRPLLKPEQVVTEADIEVKSGEDIDVIDTVPDETSTDEYEYYYVYYDEDGNMVICSCIFYINYGLEFIIELASSSKEQRYKGRTFFLSGRRRK